MKKFIIFTILVALSGAIRAQSALSEQTTAEGLEQTDNAIETLAAKLAGKLREQKAETATLGQFTYLGGTNTFNAYLHNQLTGALIDAGGQSFALLTGSGAQWIVSGEIVPIDNLIRIYSRLVRRENNAIVSQTHTDLEVNPTIATMLSSGGSGGSTVYVVPDEWEPDSWDNPLAYSVAADEADVAVVNRTLQSGDSDWFLIETADVTGLVIETTGDIDTYMVLYDADTHEELATNDDGGNSGSNALIRHFIRPGKRYMVEVRGYSSDTVGNYGFRACFEDMNMGDPTPYQPRDINTSRYVMQRLDGGRNLFLLTPDTDGTMVVETTGGIDLVMDLFDAETYELLSTDDDSGHDSNARIKHDVRSGGRYLARVRAYSDGEGEYGFKAYIENLR